MASARTFDLPRIYPITDRRLSGLSHVEQARQLIGAGARLIQLRDKHSTPAEFLAECRSVAALARESGTTVIVNDRADIALMAGAAGLHIGQDDLPPAAARELLGPGAVIGCSTHNVEQAIAAAAMPVDYIAIGPIFATATKEDPDPVVGLEGLARVRASIGPEIALVAIGGIDRTNVAEVIAAGADSAAVIGRLYSGAGSIADNYKALAAAAMLLCT
ncbi:MAG: thiamine phosphate synthase [Pyrinomonadaceae bacterium]